MIKAKNVNQRVSILDSTLDILKDIHLEIQAGESIAIVGASGSGKSTLLSMLAGLDTPSSGEIFLNEQEITCLDEEARAKVRGKLVSFVFQNFQLLEGLTALENVMMPLEVRGLDDAHAKAMQFLERVGLGQRVTHRPQQLSGGEQQRVALARAFSCEAPILFADEPTGNLDSATGKHITELLFDLNKDSNTTLVLVTHDPSLAAKCDRQYHMAAGELS